MSALVILVLSGLRLLMILVALLLCAAIIALPFVLMSKALRPVIQRPAAPPPLYAAKETTMPAFLSVISYTLLVALMLGIGLGWIGGL